MVVAWYRAVESVHAYVQDSVIQILIFEYHLIDRTRLILGAEILRSNEMAIVEISLSYRNEIESDKQNGGKGHNCHPSFPD